MRIARPALEQVRCRKAVVAPDGRSLEVYSRGQRYVVCLDFSVWDVIDAARVVEVAEALDTDRSLGAGGARS